MILPLYCNCAGKPATLEYLLGSSGRVGIAGRLDDDRDHTRRPQFEDPMP
jgi:hypothetical protein